MTNRTDKTAQSSPKFLKTLLGCTSLLTISLLLPVQRLSAQPAPKPARPDLSGDISLESTTTESKSNMVQSQELANAYMTTINSTVKQLAQGTSVTLEPVDDRAMPYLNAAYLYCSVQEGVCKYMLDALLESDIIISKQSGKTQCPNLTRFWKSYIAGDLEGRHKFMTSIAHVSASEQFSQKERPKYIRCKATVEQELSSPLENFFVARYKDSSKITPPAKSDAFLKSLLEKKINVFAETGVSVK